MTSHETAVVRRAIALLTSLVEEPCAAAPSRPCPVRAFVKQYFVAEPNSTVSTLELWQFYTEVVAAGEAAPLSKAKFLRHLTGAMTAVFGLRKSHNIPGARGRVRGYRGVGYRQGDCPVMAEELQPPVAPSTNPMIEPHWVDAPNI